MRCTFASSLPGRAAVCCCVLLALVTAARAQQLNLRAQVDQTQVTVGEPISYQVILEYQGSQINALPSTPDFGGLRVRGGPNQGQQLYSVNGNVRFILTFTWELEAPREGRYVIGASQLSVGGQFVQSQPIVITAAARPQGAGLSGALKNAIVSMARTRDRAVNDQLESRLFLRAEVSNPTPYVGEPVIVSYSLYNDRVGLQSVTPQMPRDVQGAIVEELYNARSLDYRATDVDGKQYQVALMYRQAVTPNQPGELTLQAYGLEGSLQVRRSNTGADPFGDFFNDPFFGGGLQMEIRPPEVKLQVKPLPAGAPQGFTGTIGNYQIETQLDRTQATVDDLLTYKVQIEGRGAVEQINPPAFPAPQDFEVIGQTPKVENNNKADGLAGRKVIEYVLRPKHGGRLTIPPLNYTIFNPDTQHYEVRTGQPHEVLVTPGKAAAATPAAGSPATTTQHAPAQEQLAYLAPIGNNLNLRRAEPLIDSPLFWLPQLIAGGALLFAWRRDRRQTAIDPAQVRRSAAWRKFEKRLRALRESSSHGPHDAEAVQREALALESAVRGLIGDKYNVSPEGLTRPEIEALLLGRSMRPESVQRICALLEACANVRYAPAIGSADVRQWADELSQLLREGLAT